MHKKKKAASEKFTEKLLQTLNKNRFIVYIACAYLFIYVFITVAFYPGFMSYDSINQYSQLQGLIPLNDWHPPSMVLLWQLLINMTGLTGSLLILTVGIFILSSFFLSFYVYRITSNKVISILPIAFLLMPNVLTFLGVLWKDVLLASFFMLGSVLILLGSSNHVMWQPKKSYRNALLLTGALVILIGSTFRHGVWPAFIPLLIYAAYQLKLSRRLKYLIGISSLLLLVVTPAIIARIYSVEDGKASIVIMIDDIININSDLEINNSSLTNESKDYLTSVQARCNTLEVRAYAAFLCDETHTAFVQTVQKEFDNTQDLWLKSITEKPFDYLNHRVKVFIDFLIPSYIFGWQERVEPNQFNIQALNTPATYLVEDYVKFFLKEWPAFFKPYFWLLVSIGLFIGTLKKRKQMQHSTFIFVIFSTSILFMLSFLPAAIVSDYRMTYTFTIATGLILILFIVDIHNAKKLVRK